jgi:hypothetical protein
VGDDCVADGAGAGVGADVAAAPLLPGPGGAGRGGMAVLELAEAATFRAGGDCERRADAPESSLCPGAEAAAIPAKSPLKIADTARAPAVSVRIRAASTSRAATRRWIPASFIRPVEQRSMNGP